MIPTWQDLMRPLLDHLSDQQLRHNRELREPMARHFQLTEEEQQQLLPSGTQRTLDNRIGWALSDMGQAGLVERPRRGHVRITLAGLTALVTHPVKIDKQVLKEYPSYVEYLTRVRSKTETNASPDAATQPEGGDTPSDLVERAYATNRAVVEEEVLHAALNLTPTGFEELVIRLLGAMGYGRSGSLERTSASGDAGVDGIISQDPLGLDRIYVQAKRYAVDNSVQLPLIHEFIGALHHKQSDRGVFITTSRFTKGAQEAASAVPARIELIDGTQLAELLVRYNVGVQVEQTVTLVRLDEDFFESLD